MPCGEHVSNCPQDCRTILRFRATQCKPDDDNPTQPCDHTHDYRDGTANSKKVAHRSETPPLPPGRESGSSTALSSTSARLVEAEDHAPARRGSQDWGDEPNERLAFPSGRHPTVLNKSPHPPGAGAERAAAGATANSAGLGAHGLSSETLMTTPQLPGQVLMTTPATAPSARHTGANTASSITVVPLPCA